MALYRLLLCLVIVLGRQMRIFTQPYSKAGLIGYLLFALTMAAHAEIYRWVDESGRVHFGDRRSAPKQAELKGRPKSTITTDGMAFTFLPQADAMLSATQTQPQGQATILSSGYWRSHNGNLETKSLLQFEITPLLDELNKHKHKLLANASIAFYANTQDKLYGQGTTNTQSPGHSTFRGDNAFYLKPVHNNWKEASVTWASFYSGDHVTPNAIRQLPVLSVPGTAGDPDKNYMIDATELVAALILAQQREFTGTSHFFCA